ncbi:hypothetical protein HPB47_025441 [Ixodes persulcatus]|uniref:Uncharacterized protein n=1 Tax=Ixodes persulcatus TaxID=34615 RepID=A0AC60Q1H3_IXOPE|nr:hypothetical protein HPB47_025441 [Ixodes persulcatus]
MHLCQVDNKFRLHRITSQIRQYELIIDALPHQAATEIRDILLSPLGDTPYDTLKEAMQRRLQQHLSAEELGDRRTSQFLRHLQHLLGDKAASIDALSFESFSYSASCHPFALPFLELNELADRIIEVNSPTNGATQRTSDLTSDIAELRKVIGKLTAEVSELRRESSQHARSTGTALARPCRPTHWSRQLLSILTIFPFFSKVAVPIPPTV